MAVIKNMEKSTSLITEVKTRRKLLAGIGLFSLFSLWKTTGLFSKKKEIISCTPPADSQTMKVLSQDGRLVEIDISNIKSRKGKVSDQELRDWVKK